MEQVPLFPSILVFVQFSVHSCKLLPKSEHVPVEIFLVFITGAANRIKYATIAKNGDLCGSILTLVMVEKFRECLFFNSVSILSTPGRE